MKVALVFVLAAVFALAAAQTRETYGPYTLYNQDLFTTYVSNPLDPLGVPGLTHPDEEQLCYLVGVISGCSGCEHGTQNLCAWVGQTYPVQVSGGGEFFQCVPARNAAKLEDQGVVYDASYLCPVDPHAENPYTFDLWTAIGPVVPEIGATIHNEFHEMHFGDVDHHPWAVDRSALYSEAGAMNVFGINVAMLTASGGFSQDFGRWNVTCATLNDPEALLQLKNGIGTPGCPTGDANPHRYIEELVNGVLANENEAFCLKAIWGAYLSTRCVEYGRAVSGISFSLWRQVYDNCKPDTYRRRESYISPTLVNIGGNGIPFNTFGLPVVPDGTPFALTEFPIKANEKFEHFVGIDYITLESSRNYEIVDVFCPIG